MPRWSKPSEIEVLCNSLGVVFFPITLIARTYKTSVAVAESDQFIDIYQFRFIVVIRHSLVVYVGQSEVSQGY
jgi:hypothetical protein